mmetsp:Transcript_41707/g.46560  ORF Transcript_41707/g.46560 Transcript_41707/m.46560 type:complete len:111 (+) Transcript_41707:86-418(+)
MPRNEVADKAGSSMFFLTMIRPKSSWYRAVTGTIKKPHCPYQIANHEVILSQRKNFASSSSSSRRQNSWLNDHTNYNRNRHSNVNRSTGTVFLVITSVSSVAAIIIMGKS